jgi:hypothetical protein
VRRRLQRARRTGAAPAVGGDYDSAPGRPAAARPGAPTPAPPAAQPSAGAAAAGSASTRAFPPHPEKPWVEISGDDVLALHERGDVPFLDARRTNVYRQGHIAGARPVLDLGVGRRREGQTVLRRGPRPESAHRHLLLGRRVRRLAHARDEAPHGGLRQRARLQGRIPGLAEARSPVHTGDTP